MRALIERAIASGAAERVRVSGAEKLNYWVFPNRNQRIDARGAPGRPVAGLDSDQHEEERNRTKRERIESRYPQTAPASHRPAA